ncbi:MAG: complex I NDUFA9 subunit family protein [Geminicoccaceae bacterium]|nr:complex I NDUFA9 subunit family protein [Geminicoccaceae bacterium]
MRDKVVTLFGGTGFVGTQIVKRLAERGATIRAVTRAPHRALHLKPLGNVGQINLVPWRGGGVEALRTLVRGTDLVVNLVGILFEGRKGDFMRVHADFAGNVASAAKAEGVPRLLHMSALGADPDSPALYGRSKAEGEKRVMAAFKDATVFRPSIVFGPGDGFFERFGRMMAYVPAAPLIDGGTTRFQPVYVGDVADAFVTAAERPDAKGRLYELGGPGTYTFKELLAYLAGVLDRRCLFVPLPSGLARFQARFLEYLPEPPLTRDQLELLKVDNVVGGTRPGLEDLGITPTPIETTVPAYIKGYVRRRPAMPTQ